MKVVEMHFLADVYVPCELCQGKRFNDATLRVTYKGLNVAQGARPVGERGESSTSPSTRRSCACSGRSKDVGMGLHQARPA